MGMPVLWRRPFSMHALLCGGGWVLTTDAFVTQAVSRLDQDRVRGFDQAVDRKARELSQQVWVKAEAKQQKLLAEAEANQQRLLAEAEAKAEAKQRALVLQLKQQTEALEASILARSTTAAASAKVCEIRGKNTCPNNKTTKQNRTKESGCASQATHSCEHFKAIYVHACVNSNANTHQHTHASND